MKNLNLLFLGAILIVFAGCNTGLETSKTSVASIDEKENISKFLYSVDSIGVIYKVKCDNVVTRGSGGRKLFNELGKQAVDVAGTFAGRYVGQWVGGSLGSLTGNPGVTILGWYAGRKIGPYVCSALASGIASIWLSNEYIIENPEDIKPVGNFDIHVYGDLKSDSIGYFHNVVMCKVVENEDKYIDNGIVDVSLLYDDIISYCAELGYYSEELATDESVKTAIIDLVIELADTAALYETGVISEKELVEKQSELLFSNFSMSDDEKMLIKDFSYKVVVDCAGLTDELINEYAAALNEVIENSSLSDSLKEEVATSAQIAINSTLCWQQ